VSGGGPSAVSVAEETPVSLLVSWVPPNAHVLQYRLSYTALSSAEPRDTTVSTVNFLWIVSLQSFSFHLENYKYCFVILVFYIQRSTF